jgi:SAM-dependent methyltransferase
VRERLRERFGGNARIAVIAPEDLAGLADASLDLVVANSLLQYLSLDELRTLLAIWSAKLKPEGRLVLADVVPPDVSPVQDARALMSFAWQGGFLWAAALGLVRTAFSEYRRVRDALGLSHYGEAEMIEILRSCGYTAERRPQNLGHNQARLTFLAQPG